MTQPRPPTLDEPFSTSATAASAAIKSSPDDKSAVQNESQGSGNVSGAVLLMGVTCVVVGLILAVGGLQGTTVIGSIVGAREGVDDFAPGVLMAIFGVVSIYWTDWIGRRG